MVKNEVPVHVNVSTQIKQGNELEEFTIETTGNFTVIGDVGYLRYYEKYTDQADALVTLKFKDEQLQLTRRQEDLLLRMIFDKQTRQRANYRIGANNLSLETLTQDLQINLIASQNSGAVLVDYQLHSGHELLGEYKIRLQFNA